MAGVANSDPDLVGVPVGDVTLGGIPFYLTMRRFRSQASPSPNNTYPTWVSIPAGVDRPLRLHLLLTAGNAYVEYSGRVLGQVVAICDGNSWLLRDVVLGQDVREWHPADNVISTTSNAREVWRGPIVNYPDLYGTIDLLSLDLPEVCRTSRLEAVEFWDASTGTVDSLDPAFNLTGLTVEYQP